VPACTKIKDTGSPLDFTGCIYVQWNQSFANVGRVVSTRHAWPGTGITGIYSPATTLVGAIRGIDPSHNFEILHLSISGRRFTAQGTPAP
jgi:hypothetical protein